MYVKRKNDMKETKDIALKEMIFSFDSDYDRMNEEADRLLKENAPVESYTTSIEEFRQAGLDAIKKQYNK